VDVSQKLDEIVAAVGDARSMPMSASCVVNRQELLAMLEEVRAALPGSLAQAEEVLGGREQVVAEAQQEAQRIIESARAEHGSLVSGTEIARGAQSEADRILAEARREAEEIRAEADDYVDSKLANFEVVLGKTIGSVNRGREKLLGAGPGAEEWNEEYAEDAPERTTDPQAQRQRADEYVDARLGSVAAVLEKTLEAVGRGRQKLLGHRPIDELAAHIAAQDGVEQPTHTSDADYARYLADLAPDGGGQAAEPATQQPPVPEPVAAQPAVDPYYAQQPAYAEQYASQDAYGQQYAQQGYDQQAYAGQYADQFPPQDAYGQQYAQQGYDGQYYPQMPQQAPALDETSFFDTGMIDLNQVHAYEQGYGQGR
jgi:cell division septum initiation protein DivIVA